MLLASAHGDVDVVMLLIDKGILTADDVVRPGVTVRSGARRNRHTRIEFPDGTGLFVKRPEPRSPSSAETLVSEGRFYLRHGALDGALARLVDFDPSSATLVLELLSRHRNLRDVCLRGGIEAFPIAAFRAAARALARVHALPADGPPVVRSIEWVTGLYRPGPEILGSIGPGGLVLLEMIQASPTIGAGLARLGDMWRPEAVIHGDVRADNIMVRTAAGQPMDLRVIDWELSQTGDPAWDVAGLFEAAVSLAGPDTPGGLPVIQATCRGLFTTYVSARGLTSGKRRDLRRTVMVYCAARIVQSVMETSARADAVSSDALVLMQLAENILDEPARAATSFFALP